MIASSFFAVVHKRILPIVLNVILFIILILSIFVLLEYVAFLIGFLLSLIQIGFSVRFFIKETEKLDLTNIIQKS
jgi:hypothetical protein